MNATTQVYRIPRSNLNRIEYLTQNMGWTTNEEEAVLFTEQFAKAIANHLVMLDSLIQSKEELRTDGHWISYEQRSVPLVQ